jgi:hypothetical protein
MEDTIFGIKTANMAINKAKFKKLIVEKGTSETANADIEYFEGYENADGEFVSCGVNKLHIKNTAEITDGEGNVTTPATTDFNEFMVLMNQAADTEAGIVDYLISKVGV